MTVVLDSAFVFLSACSMMCFLYLYNKDKDKRKLMFIHGFLLIFINHLSNLVFPMENNYILTNLESWFVFPMICAFLIAALSSIFKPKKFYKIYQLFFATFITTSVMILIPLPWNYVTDVVVPVLAISVVFVSVLSTVMNRQLPNLMFLCSVLAIVVVEISKGLNASSNFMIFCYGLAHVFLFLVFITSRNSNTNNITSFFSLEKKLEITQKELETSKERLVKVENIFSASPHPILVVDLDGNVVEYNRATQRLYGFRDEENITGNNYSMFIAKQSRGKVQEIMKKVRELGTITNIEINAVDKTGIEFPAELSASIIKNYLGAPTGFVVITEDIAERKLMENELRRHTEELGELVEERTRALKQSQEKLVTTERLAAIGQAATMVGHDLRNPLQAIENGVYILKKTMGTNKMPPNIRKTIIAIDTAVDYADNIVKNLQSFTKIKQPLLVKTDINVLIEGIFSLIHKPSNVKIVFGPETLPLIELDKDMIRRVFVNLASNAIQAMKDTGGTLTVTTKKFGEWVKISFKDTGIGIPKEAKKRLFTAFFTTKAQGMGVGLAICKRFINLHEGKIEVKSTEGKGAEFTVMLPLKREIEKSKSLETEIVINKSNKLPLNR